MPVVIKIVDNAAGFPCPFKGQYLEAFDPEYGGTTDRGRGLLLTTPDVTKAKVFSDPGRLLEFWKQQSPTVPIRDMDGKPNRPLTAFTIEVEVSPNTFTDMADRTAVLSDCFSGAPDKPDKLSCVQAYEGQVETIINRGNFGNANNERLQQVLRLIRGIIAYTTGSRRIEDDDQARQIIKNG